MPHVSIVTPSFNQGRFIERTIRSVLDQEVDAADLEYVVVDGGSSDQTVDVLAGFDGRLRWVSEPDGGQADAINKGLAMTSGDIIGWLNSDDVYYPSAIRTVCQFFDAHPECDVVYGDADHIDEHDGLVEPYSAERWDFDRLKDVCYLCQPAVFFRRRVVERAGTLNAKLQYCMDYEYWLRLAQRGLSFSYVPQRLAGSRLYRENKTLGSRVRVHAEINDMLRMRLGRVSDRWLFNYAHALLEPTPIRPTQPIRFALAVSALGIYASLRWNHTVSRSILSTTREWVVGGLRTTLQSDPAR